MIGLLLSLCIDLAFDAYNVKPNTAIKGYIREALFGFIDRPAALGITRMSENASWQTLNAMHGNIKKKNFQCPPLAGPIRLNRPAWRSFRTARSAALSDFPVASIRREETASFTMVAPLCCAAVSGKRAYLIFSALN